MMWIGITAADQMIGFVTIYIKLKTIGGIPKLEIIPEFIKWYFFILYGMVYVVW